VPVLSFQTPHASEHYRPEFCIHMFSLIHPSIHPPNELQFHIVPLILNQTYRACVRASPLLAYQHVSAPASRVEHALGHVPHPYPLRRLPAGSHRDFDSNPSSHRNTRTPARAHTHMQDKPGALTLPRETNKRVSRLERESESFAVQPPEGAIGHAEVDVLLFVEVCPAP
jgi:hypothetical protein